jgi:hypothetical protein
MARSVVVPRYIRYGWAGVVTHFVYNGGNFPLGSLTSE